MDRHTSKLATRLLLAGGVISLLRAPRTSPFDMRGYACLWTDAFGMAVPPIAECRYEITTTGRRRLGGTGNGTSWSREL